MRDPNRPHPPRPPRAPHQLHHRDEAAHYVQMMRAMLAQAHALGIPTVSAWPGRRSDDPDRDEEMAYAARIIGELAAEAHALGIRLAVEAPHCYSLLHNIETVAVFFAQAQSPHLGLILDSSHWRVLGYDLGELLRRVGGRLAHVHLRDAAGPDTADFRQNLELTPGRGEVDFAAFGAALDRLGYAGHVTLELEYRGWRLHAIDAEVRFAVASLRRCGWGMPPGVR